MTEEQHKDNLGQFFKKNLENYSPEPATDFWTRLAPAIPAKPTIWNGWVVSIGKIIGAVVVIGAVTLAGMAWYADHEKVKELSNLVAELREQLESVENRNKNELNSKRKETKNNINSKSRTDLVVKELKGKENSVLSDSSTKSKEINSDNIKLKENLIKEINDGLIPFAENLKQTMNTKKRTFKEKNDSSVYSKNTIKATVQSVFSDETIQDDKIIKIKLLTLNTLPVKQKEPSVKNNANKVLKSLSRFSIEAGTSAFTQPLGRLYSDSSNFEPGKLGLSPGGGLFFNFEINRTWLLQSGFYYKNIKSSNLSMKYNSFPFAIRKKYGYGLKKHLEIKLGVCLNSLISATNNEGIPTPGLKKAYVDILTGAAYNFRVSKNINFIIEPNAGYSLSPIVNNKRSINFGLYAGIRYSFFIKPF